MTFTLSTALTSPERTDAMQAYDLTAERMARREMDCPKRLIVEGQARERLESLNRDAVKHFRRLNLAREDADLAQRIDKARADATILLDIAEIMEAMRAEIRKEVARAALTNGDEQ